MSKQILVENNILNLSALFHNYWNEIFFAFFLNVIFNSKTTPFFSSLSQHIHLYKAVTHACTYSNIHKCTLPHTHTQFHTHTDTHTGAFSHNGQKRLECAKWPHITAVVAGKWDSRYVKHGLCVYLTYRPNDHLSHVSPTDHVSHTGCLTYRPHGRP